MKEFLRRTISAIFLVVLIIGVSLLPDLLFFAVITLFFSLAAWEMAKLIGGREGFVYLAVINFLLLFFSLRFGFFSYGVLMVIFMSSFYSLLFTGKSDVNGFVKDISASLLPPLILSPTLFHIFPIWAKGKFFFYLLIVIISIADTAAYLFGMRFGKHRIYPAASPNKSWEGFFAALIFGTLSGLFGLFLHIKPFPLLVIGFITTLFAQLSDPFESLFKRAAHVKDSSHLIPGHGGVLDRIDSYILGAPVFYYLLVWFLK